MSYKVYNYGVEIAATINESAKTAHVVTTPNTAYQFTVKALNGSLDASLPSNQVQISSLDLSPVAGISHLVDDGVISLTWTASADATSYKIYYKTHVGGTYDGTGLHFTGIPATSSPIPAAFASLDMTNPQHPIAKLYGVSSTSTYHFGVSVMNGASEGSTLDYAPAVQSVLVPPTNLVVTTQPDTSIKLAWTPGVGDTATTMWRIHYTTTYGQDTGTGLRPMFDTAPADASPIDLTLVEAGDPPSVLLYGAVPGTAYWFWVEALDGASNASTALQYPRNYTVPAVGGGGTVLAAPPTRVSVVVAQTTKQITLNWH